MKIGVFGAGYVGLTLGPCLSKLDHDVTCVDIDEQKIERLNEGIVPIYEPGLEEIIRDNVDAGRLSFTTDFDGTVKESEVLFICVGTPEGPDGRADLSHVFNVAKGMGQAMEGYKVVAIKSTVEPGTAKRVSQILSETSSHAADVVSNPEFLKEGKAIDDFLRPDRIVIGVASKKAEEMMKALYEPLTRNGHPVLVMSNVDAELVKYASNAALATKISFINELANITDRFEGNIDNVRKGMCADSRIGDKFYYPGHGYGGSCFPKDVQALIQSAADKGYEARVLEAVDGLNDNQKTVLVPKMKEYFGSLSGRHFALWGLSFKPETDDTREAPALYLAQALLEEGATISAYCPKGIPQAREVLPKDGRVRYADSKYSAVKGADALILATEWLEFQTPDFAELKQQLRTPVIFDGKNIFPLEKVAQAGFDYIAVGKRYVHDDR